MPIIAFRRAREENDLPPSHRGQRVTRNRTRDKIDNDKWNERSPSQRFCKLSILLVREVFRSHQRQKNHPRQKIKDAVWHVENPTAKLEVGAAEPAGELL